MNKILKTSLLTFAMILLFVGCSQETPKKNIEDSNVYEELNIPTLKVTADGIDVSVEKGGYSWDTGNQSVRVDAASSEQIAEKMEGTKLTPQSEITLDFSRQPDKVSISLKGDVESNITPYIFENNKFATPQEEGTYVYEIVGEWSEGEISFTIKVIISK